MSFLISTKDDFAKAALEIASGALALEDIEFAEYITDSIKIYSDNFQSAKLLDYRIALLMVAAQQEVLNLYSIIFGHKIKLKNLDNFPFLILKFEIDNGCINLFSKIKDTFFEEIFKEIKKVLPDGIFQGMTGTQKILALLIVLAIVGAFHAPATIRAFKSSPEVADILENNEEIIDIVSKNQLVSNTIINNLGDGYVEINGKEYTAHDYKNAKLKKPNSDDLTPSVRIENIFFIQKYDFSTQKVLIFAPNSDSFWASTKWLNQADRDRLKHATSEAIEKQIVAKEILLVACKIKNNKVIDAIVEHLGKSDTQHYLTFSEALTTTHDQPEMRGQGNLMSPD